MNLAVESSLGIPVVDHRKPHNSITKSCIAQLAGNRARCYGRMVEEKPFHFLSTEEFNRLTTEEKAAYMVKGIEELKKIIESFERQARERGRSAR